ncbi:hypothetical protein [Stieleria varia]|uniref:Uncharacterized protein n=1 Tax=Stieleria varia TaxID=2528005 RepID=A0A5C6B8W6_9BACT|nr:hypothetical protein [Stieleria varia]TWU07706.1 hypothetical protein Pla52n_02790 [Stieleria varia]
MPRRESLPSDSQPQLSLFRGDDPRQERELDRITGIAEKRTRTMPLRILVPLLMDAHEKNRFWLEDFAEDVVHVDADLHEILIAYQKIRISDAA